MSLLSENQEIEIIKNVQNRRDTNSFGLLVDEYQDVVYNYCFRFFGKTEDAFDCSQDIFVKLFQQIDDFRFRSKFSTWMYKIMINTCNNKVKSKSYKKQSLNISISNISSNSVEAHFYEKTAENPEKILLNKELSKTMNSAINVLGNRQKYIIILRDIEGRSYEEIAEITNLNIGTVKSTLSRARIKVANELKKYV